MHYYKKENEKLSKLKVNDYIQAHVKDALIKRANDLNKNGGEFKEVVEEF